MSSSPVNEVMGSKICKKANSLASEITDFSKSNLSHSPSIHKDIFTQLVQVAFHLRLNSINHFSSPYKSVSHYRKLKRLTRSDMSVPGRDEKAIDTSSI